MIGYPKGTVWVRHSWVTEALDDEPPDFPRGLRFRDALPDEGDRVVAITVAAYASDPIWNEMLPGIKARMTSRVAETFGRPGCRYLVAVAPSGELVACSGVAIEHPTGQNFLTGICVLGPYQRRGLGRRLLWESLLRLRDLGVDTACVYTERGSIADRHVYPMFGSWREEGVQYPGAQ